MPKISKINGLLSRFKLLSIRTGPALVSIAAFGITAAVVLFINGKISFNINEFEAGKVADRDVIASEPVSFIDVEATTRRINARIQQVPPVFSFDLSINREIRTLYEDFAASSQILFRENSSLEEYISGISQNFSGIFDREALFTLYHDPDREASLNAGGILLDYFMYSGIIILPDAIEILAEFNPDYIELLRNYEGRTESELLPYDHIITKARLDRSLSSYIQDHGLSRNFSAGIGAIVLSILQENVFFSPEYSQQRKEEAQSQLEPVYRYIERGDQIIRRGFVITEGEMEELRALNLSLERRDPRLIAGQILLLMMLYLFLVSHMGKRTTGRILRPAECYLITFLAAAYLIGASIANGLVQLSGFFPISILIPTALAVMLPGILLGFSTALVSAMIFPLGAFLLGAFDVSAYIFALCSGVAASHVFTKTQKRMDLVKAGLLIAAANAASALIVLLLRQAPVSVFGVVLFWAAFNGLACGLLVTGILPVLEQILNAVTPFRLIELSDLNSPILKRLFNTAPGTYSHSIMVANLAEAACQEIGADALLARVGAYYHDIGKMDQSAYFVENQTSYNKHKELSPRHSATMIKSHVLLGIERARSIGLPEAVIDFIAEHHGNSIITWFYSEALKQQKKKTSTENKTEPVNIEDFRYPGPPPRSKESAVVMLADMAEAAARVLKKPTPETLKQFIQELFDAKMDHGQLAHSDLTFRELEVIKKTFVKVLSGYYHSRIDYPKLPLKNEPLKNEQVTNEQN